MLDDGGDIHEPWRSERITRKHPNDNFTSEHALATQAMPQEVYCTHLNLLFGLICGRKSALEVLDSALLLLGLLLKLSHPILSTHTPGYSACPHRSSSEFQSPCELRRSRTRPDPRGTRQLLLVPASFTATGFTGGRNAAGTASAGTIRRSKNLGGVSVLRELVDGALRRRQVKVLPAEQPCHVHNRFPIPIAEDPRGTLDEIVFFAEFFQISSRSRAC